MDYEEGVKFTPVGDSIIEFEWLDLSSDIISDQILKYCRRKQLPTLQRCIYNSTGNPIVVEDEIIINIEEPPFNVESVVEYGEDGSFSYNREDVIELCSDVLPVLINSQYESETASFEWC